MAKYTIKLKQEFEIQVDEKDLETAIDRAKDKIAWYQFGYSENYDYVGHTKGWKNEELGEFNP